MQESKLSTYTFQLMSSIHRVWNLAVDALHSPQAMTALVVIHSITSIIHDAHMTLSSAALYCVRFGVSRKSEKKGFYCPVVRGVMRCLGRGKGRVYPPIDATAQSMLRLYYGSHNRDLARLLLYMKVPLPAWLKQSIARKEAKPTPMPKVPRWQQQGIRATLLGVDRQCSICCLCHKISQFNLPVNSRHAIQGVGFWEWSDVTF